MYLIAFLKPLKRIRSRIWDSRKAQFGNQLSGSNIGTTSPICNQATYLPLDGVIRMKNVFYLTFLLGALFYIKDPLENKKFHHIWS